MYSSVGGGDDFLGEALGIGGAASHGCFSDTHAHEEQTLRKSSHWGDIDGLSFDSSSAAESGAVFSGSSFASSFDEDLDGVSSGHEVDDIEDHFDNPDGLGLLAWVSALELDAVNESLHDGAGELSEGLELVSASSVGHENLRSGGSHGDLVDKDFIGHFHFVVPFAEELWLFIEFDSLFVSNCSLSNSLSKPFEIHEKAEYVQPLFILLTPNYLFTKSKPKNVSLIGSKCLKKNWKNMASSCLYYGE